MKTTFISAVLLLGALTSQAQTESKQTTVHIKEVKNINGVETVTDTTYTTSNPSSIKMGESTIRMNGAKLKNGSSSKTIIINDDNHASMTKEEMGKMMANDFVIGGTIPDSIDLTGKTLTLKRVNYNGDKEAFANAEQIEIFIVSKIKVIEADGEDMKRLKDQTGKTDGKLNVEKMNFYPNPNSGKFNLTFTLPDKADTEITILNTDGKIVYKENLPGFSNTYDKEIDISKNAKGIYFVKVEQGKHSHVKKIVLE